MVAGGRIRPWDLEDLGPERRGPPSLDPYAGFVTRRVNDDVIDACERTADDGYRSLRDADSEDLPRRRRQAGSGQLDAQILCVAAVEEPVQP